MPLKTPGFGLAALLLLGALVPLRAEVLDQVLVKVNGDMITLSDFEKRQLQALQDQPELAKLPPNSPQIAQAIARSAPTLILSAVDDLLYLQRAREHGWTLTDDKFNEILQNIRKANNLEDEAAFQRELQAAGLSRDELRRKIEHDLLIEQVQRADVVDKINVTEEEVEGYYKTHAAEFTTPAEVTLRELLIAVPASARGVNVAQDDEARAKAEEARKRLLAGEPFPKLVAELSSSASKANGGQIGPIRYDELSPALQKMLDAMMPGDITDVLASAQGYQILKLEARTDTKIRTLAEARDDVSRRVAQQKSQGELFKYLEKLRSQAKITWRHEELQKAYDQALAQRRAMLGLAPMPADAKS
jgi:peptidyl-prolyl cis-trans isomerase SurA